MTRHRRRPCSSPAQCWKITDQEEIDRLVTEMAYVSMEPSGQPHPPIAKLDEGMYIAHKLTPTQVRMAVFSAPKSANYKELFETIVPEQ